MTFCTKLIFFCTWVRSTICSKLLWWWGHQSMCKQWYYLPRERRKPSDFAQKCHQLTDTTSFNSKVELPNKTTFCEEIEKNYLLHHNLLYSFLIHLAILLKTIRNEKIQIALITKSEKNDPDAWPSTKTAVSINDVASWASESSEVLGAFVRQWLPI